MMKHAVYASSAGVTEHFFAGSAVPGADFESEALRLLAEYEDALRQTGCSGETELIVRCHLSDVTNQAPRLRALLQTRNGRTVLIGQPPADRSRIALEAWHMTPRPDRNYHLEFRRMPQASGTGSYEQTVAEFEHLAAGLAPRTVRECTVRTWLYCRDVDNNYGGLVRARNDFFARQGITEHTGFIASTGIEGQQEEPSRLVRMDSLNVFPLRPGQLLHVNAPEFLCPTIRYHVSFERASVLRFGDREHCFISGTASIDSDGQVVHPFDVRKQAERMLQNVEALLQKGGSSLAQLKQATVYLRDLADAPVADEVLKSGLPPELPVIFVKAPVCRPAWLVEMEAVAVTPAEHPEWPPLA